MDIRRPRLDELEFETRSSGGTIVQLRFVLFVVFFVLLFGGSFKLLSQFFHFGDGIQQFVIVDGGENH
ncbi:MAG TPA: hypothetical protein VMX35_10815, partial [Acidobacteriota bacterium]|nr:hypothetical protein [Acidobacteriota bacterium]